MQSAERVEILYEQTNHKLDAIMEYVKDIPDIKQRVTRLEGKVDQLQSDMVIVKDVLREHSHDITRLKAATKLP